ncbi:polymerase [Malaciobacter canalis]|uniref:Polymerase n=1 Tax=Malaciobacter canalis TaxID=1912871 RepID=A0ABX4LUD6_9BACT|nr:O-antigen ligase family protein [Malaciobacter canalis]PHO09816.1 polymerase [Malaciobacter canalis]QEE33435.1 putative membrane protein [Malaciobacter canalis]
MKINEITHYLKNEDKLVLFIYFYCFIMPWNFSNGQFGTLTIILFISWLIKYKDTIIKRFRSIFNFKPLVLLIIFILYTYISSLWSESLKDGLDYVNSFHKYYFLMIPVLFTTLNEKEAKKAILLFIISFSLYTIFSFLIYLGMFTISDTNSTSSNPKGIMGYAIVTQYMAIGAICSFIIAFFSGKKNIKVLFYFLSFINFITLFVNNSRTAQLAFLLSIISIIILMNYKKIFNLKSLLFFSIFFSIILVFTYILLDKSNKLNRYEMAINEVKEVFTKNKFEGSVGLRIYFNKVGIEALKENPIFGFGPEDNVKFLENYQKNDSRYTYEKIFSTYHSEHFDLISRYGLLGYLLLIASILWLLILLKKYDLKYFLIGTTFYIVIFYISFANATFAKKPINYILISLFVLLSVIVYKKSIEKKKND